MAAVRTPGTLFWISGDHDQFSGLAFEGTFTVINPHTNENVGAGFYAGLPGRYDGNQPQPCAIDMVRFIRLNNNIWLGVSSSAPLASTCNARSLGRPQLCPYDIAGTYNRHAELAFRLNNE